jgi:mRNA interferase RelE/StbE
MLPCEMGRYITGFEGEARQYGVFSCSGGARRNCFTRKFPDLRQQDALTIGKYGYILARMPFEIVLMPEAFEDLKRFKARARAEIRTAFETHLRHEPQKVSRSRIKRLRGFRKPQYRLRVGEVRVFYDVTETTVEVLAIVTKLEAESWLAQFAKPA